jgi:hypothetical protein
VVDWVLQRFLDVCADRGHRGREGVKSRRFVGRVAVDWVAVRYACRRRREKRRVSVVGWQKTVGRDGREGEEGPIMRWMVLTCRLHQSRLALLPVAVLHHLEEKGVRVRPCCEGGSNGPR